MPNEASAVAIAVTPDPQVLLTAAAEAEPAITASAAPLKVSGKLTVHLKRAAGLKAADTGFMSSGKSDPYVKLIAGGEERKSKHIDKTLDPEFDETFTWEMERDKLLAQPLELQFFDSDLMGFATGDDKLGCINAELGWIKTKQTTKDFEAIALDTQGTCDFSIVWEEQVPPEPVAPTVPPAAPQPKRANRFRTLGGETNHKNKKPLLEAPTRSPSKKLHQDAPIPQEEKAEEELPADES